MTDKNYDVVIIGAGLGGLLCADILAKEGLCVCVLEKNNQVGGSLQTFSRDKCILDTGVHYIGGFGVQESLRQYFKYAGIMDDLNVRQMDTEAFDIITFEDDTREYPQAQGYKRFSERLIEIFPQEKEGILAYCDLMQAFCRKFPMYSLDITSQYPDNFDHLHLNAKETIAGLVRDEKLRAVLAGNNMVYAGDENTPFYIHALVTNAYIESSWRCVDGGGQISKLLVREIRKQGGEVYRHCQVVKMHFDGKGVSEVELQNGERIKGKKFISNIHPIATLQMIDETHIRKAYRSRINSLSDTVSTFCVHLTFAPETVPYINSNYYHLRRPDAWSTTNYNNDHLWPQHYMISMGASSKSPEYTDNVVLMAYMKPDEVQAWTHTHNTVANKQPRGADYEAFKQIKTEICIKEIERKIPAIKGNIKGVYSSSPLSFRDYIGSPSGSLYGVYRDYHDPLKSMISPQTKIPNLWLTGQNVNLHGILGVTVGAYLTCFDILGKDYLLPKIIK